MSTGSLGLGALALVLALVPLLPQTGPLTLLWIALALPLALVAVGLGLAGRTRALRTAAPLALPTVALSLSVAALVLALGWLLGLVVAAKHRPPQHPPVGGTAALGTCARARYAGRLTDHEHRTQPQLHQEPVLRRPQGRAALPLPPPAA